VRGVVVLVVAFSFCILPVVPEGKLTVKSLFYSDLDLFSFFSVKSNDPSAIGSFFKDFLRDFNSSSPISPGAI